MRRDRNLPEQNNSNRAYQLEKDLTSEKQGRPSTIQGRSGKFVTEEQEILSRWTVYCSELYSHESCGDTAVLELVQAGGKTIIVLTEICNRIWRTGEWPTL